MKLAAQRGAPCPWRLSGVWQGRADGQASERAALRYDATLKSNLSADRHSARTHPKALCGKYTPLYTSVQSLWIDELVLIQAVQGERESKRKRGGGREIWRKNDVS